MLANPQLQTLIEQSANALGLELVDLERAGQGVIRVFVDRGEGAGAVTVDDCERLSHQLTQAFAVDGVAYERLEVSSPGIDRPLKKLSDFARFAGQEATVKLRMAVAAQRVFTGVVVAPDAADDGEAPRPGLRIETPQGVSLLRFKLEEVERARLVPMIDFKRKAR